MSELESDILKPEKYGKRRRNGLLADMFYDLRTELTRPDITPDRRKEVLELLNDLTIAALKRKYKPKKNKNMARKRKPKEETEIPVSGKDWLNNL